MNIVVPAVVTRSAVSEDLPAIIALQALAFSPGRFARTAYRVREGAPDHSPYCRVAYKGERLVAALRMTEIKVGGRPGALFLGPLAVDPEEAGRGYARRLVAESLDAGRDGGIALVVLVGDMAYYGRLGFAPVRSAFPARSIRRACSQRSCNPAPSRTTAGRSRTPRSCHTLSDSTPTPFLLRRPCHRW
jgi:predicted N-acetyltransferase YhbS